NWLPKVIPAPHPHPPVGAPGAPSWSRAVLDASFALRTSGRGSDFGVFLGWSRSSPPPADRRSGRSLLVARGAGRLLRFANIGWGLRFGVPLSGSLFRDFVKCGNVAQ